LKQGIGNVVSITVHVTRALCQKTQRFNPGTLGDIVTKCPAGD